MSDTGRDTNTATPFRPTHVHPSNDPWPRDLHTLTTARTLAQGICTCRPQRQPLHRGFEHVHHRDNPCAGDLHTSTPGTTPAQGICTRPPQGRPLPRGFAHVDHRDDPCLGDLNTTTTTTGMGFPGTFNLKHCHDKGQPLAEQVMERLKSQHNCDEMIYMYERICSADSLHGKASGGSNSEAATLGPSSIQMWDPR
jgi:hypothetical protein